MSNIFFILLLSFNFLKLTPILRAFQILTFSIQTKIFSLKSYPGKLSVHDKSSTNEPLHWVI